MTRGPQIKRGNDSVDGRPGLSSRRSSQVGWPEPWAGRRQTPLSYSFCQHVVNAQAPLVISDARNHPLVRDNSAVIELGMIAYGGIPLTTPDGHTLGALSAFHLRLRDWTDHRDP